MQKKLLLGLLILIMAVGAGFTHWGSMALPPSAQALAAMVSGEGVAVQGRNHGQFGSCGGQPGDHPATISPAEQWQQTVGAAVQLPKLE